MDTAEALARIARLAQAAAATKPPESSPNSSHSPSSVTARRWEDLPPEVQARLEQHRKDEEAHRAKVDNRQREYRILELWESSGFPLRHKQRLTQAEPWPDGVEADTYAVLKAGGILSLVGERGHGKTQLAAALAYRYLCEHALPVRYSRADDLFAGIWAEFDKDQGDGHTHAVKRASGGGLLIIDELQDRKESDPEQRELTRIIDKRYGALRPTILIANLKPDELTKAVGLSIASRMTESGSVVVCDWKNYRQAN